MIDEGVSIHHTDSDFGSKLGLCLGLASYYRTYMGLGDADDAITGPVCLRDVHLLLLAVEHTDGFQFFRLPVAQTTMTVKVEKRIDGFQVPAQVSQLLADRFADCLHVWFSLFGNLQIVSSGPFAVGAWFLGKSEFLVVQDINHPFGFLPGLIQQ